MVDAATAAHAQAHEWCFIANSVNFPVRHEPTIAVATARLSAQRRSCGRTCLMRSIGLCAGASL